MCHLQHNSFKSYIHLCVSVPLLHVPFATLLCRNLLLCRIALSQKHRTHTHTLLPHATDARCSCLERLVLCLRIHLCTCHMVACAGVRALLCWCLCHLRNVARTPLCLLCCRLAASPCNSFLFLFDVAWLCVRAFIECHCLCVAKKAKCSTSLAPLLLRRHSPCNLLAFFLRFFYTLVATPGIVAWFVHSTVFRSTSTTFCTASCCTSRHIYCHTFMAACWTWLQFRITVRVTSVERIS